MTKYRQGNSLKLFRLKTILQDEISEGQNLQWQNY